MFAKVFSQIFDSSIAEDASVRHVFMDLLILADSDGVVDMTAAAIARRTNVALDVVEAAIVRLSEPDHASRSKADEGRRIVLIDSHRDWGWQVVNYGHYRALTDNESRRSYFRDRKAAQRAKAKCPQTVLDKSEMSKKSTPVTHAEAEGEEKAKVPPQAPETSALPTVGDEDIYPTSEFSERIAKLYNRKLTTKWSPKEIKAFKALVSREAVSHEALDVIFAYYSAERAKGQQGNHRRDMVTFLNNFDGELDRATNALPPEPPESAWFVPDVPATAATRRQGLIAVLEEDKDNPAAAAILASLNGAEK